MGRAAFACACGKLTGHLRDGRPGKGTHLVCHCDDCRAADLYTGRPDPAPDPLGMFQTSPANIAFDTGADLLAAFSFGPRNLLRWHASCCGAILFSTMRKPKMAFATLRTDRLATTDALGPVVTRAFIPAPGGKTRHDRIGAFITGMLLRTVSARVSGTWKNTPFADPETGAPTVPVTLVSAAERRALTA